MGMLLLFVAVTVVVAAAVAVLLMETKSLYVCILRLERSMS